MAKKSTSSKSKASTSSSSTKSKQLAQLNKAESTLKSMLASYKPSGSSSGSSGSSGSKSTIDTITDPVTKQSYSRNTSIAGSTYQPISVSTLNSTQGAINVPTPEETTNVGDVTANNYSVKPEGWTIQDGKFKVDTAATDPYTKLAESYFKNQPKPPNTADIYQQEYENAGIAQKQQEVNNYTNQINAIVAKQQADVLSVTGQGRGIPEVIIGGQQAQINKEAAIQALPIQAQLAAAQGNLEIAQQHLDTMFRIKSADAQAEYTYKTRLIDAVFDFATKAEQRRFDEIKLKEDRTYKETQTQLQLANEWVSSAFENGAPASVRSAMLRAVQNKDYVKVQELAGPYIGLLARQQEARLASDSVSNKPLSILDIERYQDAYPDAGIQAGDSEATANAKATAQQTTTQSGGIWGWLKGLVSPQTTSSIPSKIIIYQGKRYAVDSAGNFDLNKPL